METSSPASTGSTRFSGWASPNGTVAKVAIGGGSVFTLATAQDGPIGIAVNAVNVYFSNLGNTSGMGEIVRTGIGGGTPVTLVTGLVQPVAMSLDATNLYLGTAGTGSNDSTILKVPLLGGSVTPLATAQSYFTDGAIASDASYVYWANFTGNTIAKVALGGGSALTIASSGVPSPVGVALSGTSLYFSSYGGTIGKVTPR